MARHNITGEWGEKLASDYLVSQGYSIVESNARIGHYELDIVAMHGSRIVFVEVKTRSSAESGNDPLDAIDAKKIRFLCRAANAYVRTHDIPHPVQFDVITIIGDPSMPPESVRLEHYPDAFLPPLGGAF